MTLEEGGGGWELYAGVGEGEHWGISWGAGQTSTPTQEAPNSVSTVWQSLGGLQPPAWTQLGYEGSSSNLTDGWSLPAARMGP